MGSWESVGGLVRPLARSYNWRLTAWAWMTRESNGYIEASWPAGVTGPSPTFGDGLTIPEPATLALLILSAGALIGIRRQR